MTPGIRRIQLIPGPPGPAASPFPVLYTGIGADVTVTVTNNNALASFSLLVGNQVCNAPAAPGVGQKITVALDSTGGAHSVAFIPAGGFLVRGAATATVSGAYARQEFIFDGTYWN